MCRASSKKAADALTVLQATNPLWLANEHKPGYNDPATWQAMASFMLSTKLLTKPLNAIEAFSNAYLPS